MSAMTKQGTPLLYLSIHLTVHIPRPLQAEGSGRYFRGSQGLVNDKACKPSNGLID